MAVKVVSLLQRPPDVTSADFRRWWTSEHALIAARIPGVLRYSVSFPIDGENPEFDGMAQMYFADLSALESGFASDAGRSAVASAQSHSANRLRFIADEVVIIDGTLGIGI